MENPYLNAAVTLVGGRLRTESMSSEAMLAEIKSTAESLKALDAGGLNPATPAGEGALPPNLMVQPKTAIKQDSIICCVCGESLSVLTARHLAKHGLTPAEYRKLCGYPASQPLASKSLSKARREHMQGMKLWERRKRPDEAAA